jgi:hypothetical protein
MSMRVTMGLFIIIAISSLILLSPFLQLNHAILYENGTCTNENLTKSSNQTINTNGSVDDLLKSLPSDNRMLAELVCQTTPNSTNSNSTNSSNVTIPNLNMTNKSTNPNITLPEQMPPESVNGSNVGKI